MSKGSIKWSRYDESQGLGMGYFDYQAGWLRIRK